MFRTLIRHVPAYGYVAFSEIVRGGKRELVTWRKARVVKPSELGHNTWVPTGQEISPNARKHTIVAAWESRSMPSVHVTPAEARKA